MKRSITQKLLAILMIITILATDFFVLGSGLISYAADNKTDIEFSAYFEDGKNISQSINAENSLFVEVKINGDGYLSGGKISITNSNFNIKKEILSSNTYIDSIEGNTVNLKQINEGEVAILELGIEPQISDRINTNMLYQESTVKLTGTYMEESYEGIAIDKDVTVSVNYQPDETANAELETDIITNKILEINGTNKRVVQVLIKSRLSENQYPVKQTKLNVNIPELGTEEPEVNVLASTELNSDDWTIANGTVEIIIKNDADSNNEISWNKNVYDEVIVTYLYPEEVDASKVEIVTNSEIKLYNSENTYTGQYTKGIENQEPNSIIIGKIEFIAQELYKGGLYANMDVLYNTKTTIVVTNSNVVEEIIVHDGNDVLVTPEGELPANTQFKTTEINLNKMLEILGQDGNIQVKNGEAITIINKDSTVNENGNVVIEHGNGGAELVVTVSKPEKEGMLEIKHSKVITENSYSIAELKEVIGLKTKNTTIGTNIVENSVEDVLELKETVSKAELTIENGKETLSTTADNEMTLGITLVTNGIKYDLYKNPEINIQLPSAVESVELGNVNKQNADVFEVGSVGYDETNKTIKIRLTGEQTSYPESELTQAYLQLNLKVRLSQLVTTHKDKIIMTYTNQNSIEAGRVEKAVKIEAQPGLLKMFNLSLSENISTEQAIKQQITEANAGQTLRFETVLLNNIGSDMKNVRILGMLPTIGNKIAEKEANTLETTLTKISAENATIYYTENANATTDVEDSTNGWTTDLTTLANAKLYLIKIETLPQGTYTTSTEVKIPNIIEKDKESYTQYEVIYDTETSTDIKETSRIIGLVTYVVSDLEIGLTAHVGKDELKDGDKVKEGEVIKYTVTATNNAEQTLENVQIQLNVPEGTVFVKPIEGSYEEEDEVILEDSYVYAENAYYEEITDSEKLAENTLITIPTLSSKQVYITTYEVRVKTDNSTGTEISNRIVGNANNVETKSQELKNIIEESNIRVTIKRTIDESIQLLAGGTTRYMIYVENLSDSTLNNIQMQLLSDTFNVEKIENENMSIYENIPEKIKINELKANELVHFSIVGSIDEDVKEVNTSVVVTDSNGKIYRSNALKEILPHTDATISMTSPQNGQYIKENDLVEYNITVKNTGDIEGNIVVEDIIPDFLQVQSIEINGNVIKDISNGRISNKIYEVIILQSGEEAQIRIIAKVGNVPELHHGKVITNSATVRVFTVLEDNSEVITHILQSNLEQEENVENIINGLAWLDSNGNGRKDGNEKVLSDIGVKVYDLLTKSYLLDSETKTDYKGEYSLTKIKDGSYLIVFEFDRTKYELTTAFAEGVKTSINSKAVIIDTLAAIEIKDLRENTFNMNIGLKEGSGNLIEKPTKPEKPENPEEPTDPEKPVNPEGPTDPERPVGPEKPTEPEGKSTISGYAWLDENRNGQKDDNEKVLEGIKARIYDVSNQNIAEVTTDANGKYTFKDIKNGSYIILFEYDTEEYEPTTYLAEGVAINQNSKVVLKKTNINGEEKTFAVTDIIHVQKDVENINIGLKEKLIFDLELNKYISRIVVQTNKETKAYEYKDDTFEKVEIHRKQIQGALVVLEYTIKVKNNGEIAGYAKNIVDYLPSGLTFSSELNKEWYLSGSYLFTKSLENVELSPGEEKEVKLVLTKTMTGENTGLINNRAELYEDYNKYGESDIDSKPNNQVKDEDDFGSVDVIIMIATGGSNTAYIVLLMINLVLIGIAIKLMIKNKIIILPKNKGRR